MDIDCISKITGIIAGIGTFIAAIIAWWTLREIKKQRIAAQKPQLLFKSLAIGKISLANISNMVPVDWKGENGSIENHVLFELINGGKDIAKNIVFEYKLDIQSFIRKIKEKDTDNELDISIENDRFRISSKLNTIDKYISMKVNKGESDRLEYLLTRTVQEKPSGFAIPFEYLILNSCFLYLSKKYDFWINPEEIPNLFVKTKFEDISSNSDTLYHVIDTFNYKEGVFLFSLKKTSKKNYIA